MPELPITRDDLESPSQLTLDRIAIVMLWPTDAAMRERAMTAAVAHDWRRVIDRAKASDAIFDNVSAAMLDQVAKLAHAPRFSDFERDAKLAHRQRSGCIVSLLVSHQFHHEFRPRYFTI